MGLKIRLKPDAFDNKELYPTVPPKLHIANGGYIREFDTSQAEFAPSSPGPEVPEEERDALAKQMVAEERMILEASGFFEYVEEAASTPTPTPAAAPITALSAGAVTWPTAETMGSKPKP